MAELYSYEDNYYRGDDGLRFPIDCTEPSPHSITRYIQLLSFFNMYNTNRLAYDEDNQSNSIANELLPKTLLEGVNVESVEMRDYIEESQRNADHPTSIDTWVRENPLAGNVSGPGDHDNATTRLRIDYYKKSQKRIRHYSDSALGSSMGSASTRSGTNADQQSVLWKREKASAEAAF